MSMIATVAVAVEIGLTYVGLYFLWMCLAAANDERPSPEKPAEPAPDARWLDAADAEVLPSWHTKAAGRGLDRREWR